MAKLTLIPALSASPEKTRMQNYDLQGCVPTAAAGWSVCEAKGGGRKFTCYWRAFGQYCPALLEANVAQW